MSPLVFQYNSAGRILSACQDLRLNRSTGDEVSDFMAFSFFVVFFFFHYVSLDNLKQFLNSKVKSVGFCTKTQEVVHYPHCYRWVLRFRTTASPLL